MKNTHSSSKRLESLDALRGFDLFFLVALGPLMHSLARTAYVGIQSCLLGRVFSMGFDYAAFPLYVGHFDAVFFVAL